MSDTPAVFVSRPTCTDADTDAAKSESLSTSPSTGADGESTLSFPEGGRTGWLVVLGAFCAFMSVFGLVNTAAVFQEHFGANQLRTHSADEIGCIFSLHLFIVFFVGILTGRVFDRYGARVLVAAGSTLAAASLFLLGQCAEYYQILLAYSVLGGVGGALLNTPAFGAIAHFFDLRRGLATGVATAAGGVGGVIFPLALRAMLPRLGFPWSCRVLGAVVGMLAVPMNLCIRTRLPPKGAADSQFGGRTVVVCPPKSLLRSGRFCVAALALFCTEIGLFVPVTYVVSYAVAHGFLSDRLGRFNTIACTLTLCVAALDGLWLPASGSRPMLLTFAVVFGFASGSNLSLAPVCLGQLCEAREYGRYYSAAMMLASFGSLVSVPLGGALLRTEMGWKALILFAASGYAVALVAYTTARVLSVGWRVRVKF